VCSPAPHSTSIQPRPTAAADAELSSFCLVFSGTSAGGARMDQPDATHVRADLDHEEQLDWGNGPTEASHQ